MTPTIDPAWTAVLDTPNKSIRQNVPRKGACLHHAAMLDFAALERLAMGAKEVSATAIVKDAIRKLLMSDAYRAWSLSSAWADSSFRSVETCNDRTDGWTISDASHRTLGLLVAYWSLVDGWWPHRDGDPKTWTVLGHREMYVIWGESYGTACPGGMDLDLVVRYAQDYRNNLAQLAEDLGDVMARYVYAPDRGGMLVTPTDGVFFPVAAGTNEPLAWEHRVIQKKLYAGIDIGNREWDIARQDALDNHERAGKHVDDAIGASIIKAFQTVVIEPGDPIDPDEFAEVLAAKLDERGVRADIDVAALAKSLLNMEGAALSAV